MPVSTYAAKSVQEDKWKMRQRRKSGTEGPMMMSSPF